MRFMIRVAWRNLRRNLLRSILAASAIVVGVAFCMAMTAMMDGLFLQMFNLMVAEKVGHVQIHHPDYPGKRLMYDTVDDLESLLSDLDGIESIEASSPRLFGFGLAGGSRKRSEIGCLRGRCFRAVGARLCGGGQVQVMPWQGVDGGPGECLEGGRSQAQR